MSMKNRNIIWGVLAVIALVVLLWPARNSAGAPKVKARTQRITAVNTVRSVLFTLTNSSALPGAQPGSNR